MSSLSMKLGRGCDQCPAEAIVGFFYVCTNPQCKNYVQPGSGGKIGNNGKDKAAQPRIIQCYGRYTDPDIRDNKYIGKRARDLIMGTVRLKLNGNARLCYAIEWKGEIIVKPNPAHNKPDQVDIVDVRSDVIMTYLDWDGRKWFALPKQHLLPY